MSSEKPGLALNDVHFSYPGGRPMVFDCTVPKGDFAAVMGPSGSGKSTLFSLIAGFETPLAGSIQIGALDITHLAPAERPLSIVFQDNNLFAHLDVATNIAIGIDPKRRPGPAERKTIAEALERVDLAGFEQRRPASLSGGERQRVALARALVRRRPLLLLDEPFAALGPGLRAEMLQLVESLAREAQMTTLMITHQPSDAAAIADSILFIDGGRVAATLPAADAFESSTIPGWQEYLGKPLQTEGGN